MTSANNAPTLSLAYLEAVRDVQVQMVAAMALIAWDSILTLEKEMRYIWRMRRCVSKWIYFYFRYFLLAAQIFHLAVFPSLSSGRLPDSLCVIWGQYVVFVIHITSSMTDVIFAVRVFALFNRSRRVGIFLGILILSEFVVAGVIIIHASMPQYFETCALLLPRMEMASLFACMTMVVQSILMGMFAIKHFVGVRLGWGRTPLVSFLARDATSYYVLVFLFCGALLLFSGVDDRRLMVILYWSISIYSCFGCRLVLNMQHIAKGSLPDDEIQFTSQISCDEAFSAMCDGF